MATGVVLLKPNANSVLTDPVMACAFAVGTFKYGDYGIAMQRASGYVGMMLH